MKSMYFRLDYPSHFNVERLIDSKGLAGLEPELGRMLRPGHIVFAARYSTLSGTGQVRAVGRVIANATSLQIEWRAANFELHPSPQGALQWKRAHFCFDRSVAERYRLADRVDDVFPVVLAYPARGLTAPVPAPGDDPGYIYVLSSEYGYKIGKTRHLHDRTRLFAVKLPFPFEVALTGWCAQYSRTERDLHREFAAKRLEGEWFELSDADLVTLRSRFAAAQPLA
ncbi:GIY-YIG nuclease family protein [Massilia sp. GER05]|uniref:GIY-YIG nuclease family protein n=1 Tax=Massilia sp. GER05 TaxID=3394605 RepID=UPI003F85B89F